MEALVSISLAANVLQFAQLAGKLLSEAKSIRETGSPCSLPELRKLTNELNNQTGTIHRYLLAKAGSSRLVPEDKNLIDITYECQTAGSSFSNYLDTLIQNSSSGNHLKAVVATIKFQFEHRKIEEFAVKLDRLRSTLTLSSILAFQAHTQTNQKDILERLQRLHEGNEIQLTTSSDGIRTVTDILQVNHSQTEQKLEGLDTQMRQCLQDLVCLRDTLPLTKEKEILTWLNFRQNSWRFDEVPTAYQATFDWIFEKPESWRRWADFPAHLRGDVATPYFIQGKAGSGKSTLMKHIISHSNTEAMLKEWAAADGAELIRVNFFFWNSDICQYWTGDKLEPNYTELTKAWLLLTQRSASFLKIAIFIDGIDEFEGDHRGIAKFIRSLASPQIKVIVSSRPTTACLRIFEDCPSLTLQDLTAHDMEVFVQGQLASHAAMVQLLQHHAADAISLMEEIRRKAQGVFLWVKLVVKELIEGLEDGDNVEDLQSKLQSIPGDLRQFYRHMMSNMRTEHKTQAAEIFRLMHLWEAYTSNKIALCVLHFALAPTSTYQALDVAPLDLKTSAWCVKRLSARIQSRCCGLLEVSSGYSSNMVDAFIDQHVDYIHRTVAEFLKSEDVYQELERSTRPVRELESALITGCLSRIKIAEPCFDWDSDSFYIEQFTLIYNNMSSQPQETLDAYVDALDIVLIEQQRLLPPDESRGHWSGELKYVPSKQFVQETSYSWEDVKSKASIYTFAAHSGLTNYLESCCPYKVLEDPTLVLYTFEQLNDPPSTLKFLLQHLAKLHNAELEQSLFHAAQQLFNFDTSPRGKGVANVVTACVLTTAHSAPQLLRKGWEGAPFLEGVLEQLRKSKDPENQRMGCQLSEVVEKYAWKQDLPYRSRRSELPDERARKKQRLRLSTPPSGLKTYFHPDFTQSSYRQAWLD